MAGSVDLHEAIVAAWNAADLDSQFNDYWSVANQEEFDVLHDSEADEAQPFPYCVFNQSAGTTKDKMSGAAEAGRREIRYVPWEFHVHAREMDGVDKSAKKIASELAEEIMKVFGGHPTVQSQPFTLDHGGVLISQYEADYGIRTGGQEYQWVVRFNFVLDVPVRS